MPPPLQTGSQSTITNLDIQAVYDEMGTHTISPAGVLYR